MNISLLGLDIAKNVFQLHGVDSTGKKVLRQRIERNKLSEYIANLPVCTIAMESCGGANYWARIFQKQGHTGNYSPLYGTACRIGVNEKEN